LIPSDPTGYRAEAEEFETLADYARDAGRPLAESRNREMAAICRETANALELSHSRLKRTVHTWDQWTGAVLRASPRK